MQPRQEDARGTESTVTIPVRQEELQVSKERVDTGRGVRIEKTVREQPQLVDEVLQHDEVDVQRVPVDRIVAPEDAPAHRYEGDTLIVPVLEEVLVVEKRIRIKEELHISRRVHEERVRDTVVLRSEEVSIERFDERRHEGGTGSTEH